MIQGKVGRNYRLDVFTPSGNQITIEPPFTLRFNVVRNTLASANQASLTIVNLGQSTRNQIYKDRFTIAEYWRVSLSAGYGTRLHQIFLGNILEAMSFKDGTEWITTIEAFDGMDAIQNGFIAETVAAETPNRNIIERVINNMPNMLAGFFGSPSEGEAPRGQVLMGQPAEVLTDLTGGQYFIDNETLNVLSDDEVIPGQVTLLDPSLLLSTPRRRDAFLDIRTLFEGAIQVGQTYEIQSIDSRYDGQYKVVGFTHDGVISQAESGSATTDIQLYFGAQGLTEVRN